MLMLLHCGREFSKETVEARCGKAKVRMEGWYCRAQVLNHLLVSRLEPGNQPIWAIVSARLYW